MPSHGEKVDGVVMEEVDGAGGDVNVDHPMTLNLLMEVAVYPKEALSHGDMGDGVAGDVNVDHPMTSNMLMEMPVCLKEVLSHGDMVDGAVGDENVDHPMT